MRTGSKNQQTLVVLATRSAPTSSEEEILWLRAAEKLVQEAPQICGVVMNEQPSEGNALLGRNNRVLFGEDFVMEELCNIEVSLSGTSFFQVNPAQAQRIADEILLWADEKPKSRLCDAFCGIGTVALALAQRGHTVTGIDLVPSAIEDARKAARRLGVPASFLCGRAEELFSSTDESWDQVLLNPPRKGCAPELLEAILRSRPKRLCFVSCNPRSLARDLAALQEDYQIEQVVPFDLFPQTSHVETLALLSARTGVPF
jgi:23S rRNA (uracil1939-C5)-methyltransferase